ncbi:MAG: LptF/LptG family permease [Flavobacteriaceae bacterium]
MNIDLSQFNNVNLEEENYRSTYRMQKIDQLEVSIDTLERSFSEEQNVFSENFGRGSILTKMAKEDQPIVKVAVMPSSVYDFILTEEQWKRHRILEESSSSLKDGMRNLNAKRTQFFAFQKLINLHKITLHEKYTLLFVSLLLFLIGASLGAIIRKGGIGLPLVLSVLIFLTYHYIGLFSKNAAEDNSISPFFATWLATLILTPFSIILTRRASSDKGFVSLANLIYPLKQRLTNFKFLKKKP